MRPEIRTVSDGQNRPASRTKPSGLPTKPFGLLDANLHNRHESRQRLTEKLISSTSDALRARRRRHFDFSKIENRQAYARLKIAPAIGWDVMMAAEDPRHPNHTKAVEIAQAEAHRQKVTWHPPDAGKSAPREAQ
jgi:hypothetical protein